MKFIEKADINTGRQFEADMAKFVCLVGMVIVHCFDVLVSFSELTSSVQFVFGVVLNCIFGAGTFMFCMGLGIAYSGRSTPAQLMRRGIRIFLLGYLLNLACALSYLILLRDIGLFVTYLLGPDIMQFAGLALFLFGLLLRLNVPDGLIGAIAAAMSVIGTFIHGLDLGNALLNIFCGLFVGTFDFEWVTGGVFPLFNWFIFVAAGYLFGKYLLRRCSDKSALYLHFSPVSAVIVAVYCAVAIPRGLGMMGSVLRFHHLDAPEAVVCIAGAVFALGVYHALSRLIGTKARALIVSVSKTINPLYCVQWVTIAWGTSIWVLCGKPAFSDGVIVLIGLAVFVFSALMAQLISRLMRKKAEKRA